MDESSNGSSTKPATTNTITRNSSNNKNGDTPNTADLAQRRNNMGSKDATIETLQSSTMHNNSSCSSNNLGCGMTPNSAETTVTTPTKCNGDKILPISTKLMNNNKNNHSYNEKNLCNSILTTTMAAASGLPLQQRPQQQPLINLQVNTTTGGNFGVTVDAQISVDTLKKLISKKLKVAKDRICLLHREKELQDGTLNENNLMDGSKIILIPNVETGLMAQRPENTVMQALESLNDSQVNDFLSGKTPLNLSMRLGDHMMLIQLQLSTVNPIGQNGSISSSNSHAHHHHHHHHHQHQHVCGYQRRSSLRASTQRLLAEHSQQQKVQQQREQVIAQERRQQLVKEQQEKPSVDCLDGAVTQKPPQADLDIKSNKSTITGTKRAASPVSGPFKKSDLSAFFEKHDVQSLHSIVKNFNMQAKANVSNSAEFEQSPIKSLSNLVSNSTKSSTPVKNIPKATATSTKPLPPYNAGQDSLTSRLTSCLCKRLHSARNTIIQNMSSKNLSVIQSKSASLTTVAISNMSDSDKVTSIIVEKKQEEKDAANKISTNNSVPVSNNNISLRQCLEANNMQMRPTQAAAPLGLLRICNHHNKESTSNELLHKTANHTIQRAKQQRQQQTLSSSAALAFEVARKSVKSDATASSINESLNAITDTRTLAEASRNLTQTLRKLSKEVFTNKIDLSAASEEIPRKTGSGAVIESMKNHGKGIYSGTFSGTLNPALQDRYGRPKRDISTVIHILNDLLSATPQYSRGARISLESPTSVAPLNCNASATLAASNSQQSTKNKQFTLKPYHPCLKCLRSAHHLPNGTSHDCEKLKRHSATLNCCIDGADGCVQKERVCTCRYRMTESGEREREEMCQKCLVEMENSKTKTKLDQLRLVMQQRKQKREARKLKGAPYAARPISPTTNIAAAANPPNTEMPAIISAATSPVTNTNTTILTPTKATLAASGPSTTTNNNSATPASEVSPNHIVEEVDTAA